MSLLKLRTGNYQFRMFLKSNTKKKKFLRCRKLVLLVKLFIDSWIVSWNIEGQDRLSTITQLGLAMGWNNKDTSLILQQIWANIERQACIMGKIPGLNMNQILIMGIFNF